MNCINLLVHKSLITFSFPLSLKIRTFEIDKSFLIMEKDKYIRFDWAVKRLLRNKANFDVLEGLLTVLLDRQIHIIDILESESNQQDYDDKFNRIARTRLLSWKCRLPGNYIF